MTIATEGIRSDLQAFAFESLFREELGWDTYKQTLSVVVDNTTYMLRGRAQKRGFRVLECAPGPDGVVPENATRVRIQHQVAKLAHEHLIIYTDTAKSQQVWQWVKREPGRPAVRRELRYHRGQSGEQLVQRLRAIEFGLEEEDRLNIVEVGGRVRAAFDVERITKRFYDRFKSEHDAFRSFIKGMQEQGDKDWYASLMLNRLMFVYFIQKRGFLDGDPDYLRHRLEQMRQRRGDGQFLSFYRYFLLRLFHQGLGGQARDRELDALLGKVPYLNGGLFDVHQLELANPDLDIPDEAFEQIFDFFDGYYWHLDERPLHNDREINPDVLGYIFEKYINQKQMGAYYTKEDITEYISKNTIIPFLFDAARKEVPVAFRPEAYTWRLLQETPDRYIHDAVRKGVVDEQGAAIPLPEEIEAGVHEVSKRGGWNRPADSEYALPTETWREHVARRQRCLELREKLRAGEVHEINDLITHNLDIRRFAEDVIEYAEGPELVRAFYKAITSVTVLDPTCGSGAFLFAAVNILEPLYEACLERMAGFVEDLERKDGRGGVGRGVQLNAPTAGGLAIHHSPQKFSDFKHTLEQVGKHPNRKHFILKSIILNNLYGVDIMEEAVEIAKLRLFLKLVAQVETVEQIEPLPDIDFNIRAGNTLVGFATYEDVRKAAQSRMDFANALATIGEQAEIANRAFQKFHEMQNEHGMDARDFAGAKAELRDRLRPLNDELDRYLAAEYGIDEIQQPTGYTERLAAWRESHQPFHWFVNFYGIMKRGGFDVIIGNPPYVEYYQAKFDYAVIGFSTRACANLYTLVTERSRQVIHDHGYQGMILPLAAFATRNMVPFTQCFRHWFSGTWVSFYHFRPSMLFSGGKVASIPTAVYVGTPDGPKLRLSTGVNKWATENREKLFPTLSYARAAVASDTANPHYYPKLRSDAENAILGKLLEHPTVDRYLSKARNNNIMSYRSAGGLYWKVFINYDWPYHSTSNKKCFFQAAYDRDLFVALFNSSLFWWYYTVTFDTFNVKDYMLFGFRFKYPDEETVKSTLKTCSRELMANYRVNAEHLKRGQTGSYTVYAKKAKPIIDEIDRVLAEHYGFTEEELDFIINYDIKYRMGRESNEG